MQSKKYTSVENIVEHKFKFMVSKAVKELVVKLLEAYSKTTDNTIDDKLTALVKKNLLPE